MKGRAIMVSGAPSLRDSAEIIQCHIDALVAVMGRCEGTPNDTDLLFAVSAARQHVLRMIDALGSFHTLPVKTHELMEQDRQAEYLLNELFCDDDRARDERLRAQAGLWVRQLHSYMAPVHQLIAEADQWNQRQG
jgi:aminoglycoside phosphotransferase (APT) family kinase protein